MSDQRTMRAANFDWQFGGVPVDRAGVELKRRDAIFGDRNKFVNMIEKLKFTIYPLNGDKKVTRNLSKGAFLRELKKCEYTGNVLFLSIHTLIIIITNLNNLCMVRLIHIRRINLLQRKLFDLVKV